MNRKERKAIKLQNKIDKEEIRCIYKLSLYQIDLDNNMDHFKKNYIKEFDEDFNVDNISNGNLSKDSSFRDILNVASYKKVMDVLVYRSSIGNNIIGFREVLTRKPIPCLYTTCDGINGHTWYDYYISNSITYNNKLIPVFIYVDNVVPGDFLDPEPLWQDDRYEATSSDLEEYMNYYTDLNNYENRKNNSNVIELMSNKLEDIYCQAAKDYFMLLDNLSYSESEKIEKVKTKYDDFLTRR